MSFPDEYPEYIDMLETVVKAGSHYVIGELGARYGTWGVRGVSAYRLECLFNWQIHLIIVARKRCIYIYT